MATLTILAGFYTRERVFFQDVSAESRFGPEATQTKLRSVICIPMSNNRGQVYGALFLGNQYPFSQNHVSILSLLVRQASISIANALLFKSVQQATKANLQMIQSQRQALEEARRSREDAMKATKIKSNFLASMSHELRTPFRCVYTVELPRVCSFSHQFILWTFRHTWEHQPRYQSARTR
jgi:GAF domain-containing protein